MEARKALSELLKMAEEGGRCPAMWKDGAWKNKYYSLQNIVYEAIEPVSVTDSAGFKVNVG